MKVGVLLPSRFEDPGEFIADARAMEAAGADSIWMEEGDGHDPMLVLAAIAAVTGELRLGLIRGSNPRPNVELDRRMETLQHLSRQRVITLVSSDVSPSPSGGGQRGGFSGTERWRRVEVPPDREAWARTLAEAEPDFDGVLVQLDPRLLDILRHPDDAIDRSDLMLAQG
jgi:alkanesulfonate monooxygenase SsuD/methylene tetrahydromethanopterin reductase-like flavin-dependent oxidoreductase (luciferase family)